MPYKDLKKRIEYDRQRYASDPVAFSRKNKAWRKKPPDTIQATEYYRYHGEPIENKKQRIKDQHGLCANLGCGATITMSSPQDHNHVTEVRRGVLCRDCNIALGLLRESVRVISGLAVYIEKWRYASEKAS